MSRVHTKVAHMSKQLDVAVAALNELRKMNLSPEAMTVIAEATISMRRIEQGVDASVNTRQKI